MANALNDGLNKPDQIESVNSHVFDFGSFTGSGNTTVVSFNRTFTSAPNVFCFASVGSVAVANQNVLSNIGTGSFSVAAGSNLAQFWIAIGSGTY